MGDEHILESCGRLCLYLVHALRDSSVLEVPRTDSNNGGVANCRVASALVFLHYWKGVNPMTNIERHLREAQEIEAKATCAPWAGKMGGILGPTRTIMYENHNLHLSPGDLSLIPFARNTFAQRTEAIEFMYRALVRIGASAGHPDAAEGCRLAAKLAREALAKVEALFGTGKT